MDNITNTLNVIGHFVPTLLETDATSAGKFTGASYRLLMELLLFANFPNYHLKILDWDGGGDIEDKFYFKDIDQRFATGEADLSIGFYFLTPSRVLNGRPLHPVIVDSFRAYFRQPRSMAFRNIYMEPLSISFAIGLASFTLFMMGCIFVSLHVLEHFKKVKTFKLALWWTLCLATGRGTYLKMNRTVLKILFVTGSLFFLIIFSVYSASITSALNTTKTPIRSVEDLIRYKFTFDSAPPLRNYVFSKEDIRNKINSGYDFLSDDQSFRQVMKGGHFHIDVPLVHPYISNMTGISSEALCKLMPYVTFKAALIYTGFYLSNRSPHRERLNRKIARLLEVGLNQRISKEASKTTSHRCLDYPRSNFREDLGLSDTLTPFLSLIILAVLALVISIMELYASHRTN